MPIKIARANLDRIQKIEISKLQVVRKDLMQEIIVK
jgi:hypothetical protein